MLGLALEGGGARGAFQMGVIKAFYEEGYRFDGITGTSIGAINGAVIAQGSFEEGYKFWEKADPTLFFDVEEETYKKLANRQFDKDTIIQFALRIKMIIKNRGIDTSKIRQVLQSLIDEERLRKSEILYGLVTFSVSDLKPFELYKEDIPKGQLVDYVIASATFPGFKLTEIEDRRYIDGGLYNNCPINLLVQKGIKDIIAVRTLSPGVVRTIKDPDVKVTYITPSDNLGRILDFSNDLIHRNLKMGYYDALRYLKGLKGYKYYIKPLNEETLHRALYLIPDDSILELGKFFGFNDMNPKRMLFERIIPETANRLGLSASATYADIAIGLMEMLAEEKGINRFKIYTLRRFIEEIKTEAEQTISKPSFKILDNITRRPILLKVARKVLDAV